MFGQADNSQLEAVIKEGALLVDVRSPGEYAMGNVKASVNIPLDTIPSKISAFKGKKNIVVFCRSGGRSSQAKSFLEQKGFSNVINGGTWENVNKLVTNK